MHYCVLHACFKIVGHMLHDTTENSYISDGHVLQENYHIMAQLPPSCPTYHIVVTSELLKN